MDNLVSVIKAIETFFESYPFTQDFVIACLGVIFGGFVTVLINKGAIRKQAYFDMQNKILNELYDETSKVEKYLESVEIGLSFGDMTIKSEMNNVSLLETSALRLNELFIEKRNISHKYLSGTMLEKSAQIPGKLYSVLYDNLNLIMDTDYKEKVTSDDIATLRELTIDARNLKNEVQNSLEKLIYPSLLSRILRKFKTIKIKIGNVYGMIKVGKTERKRMNRR